MSNHELSKPIAYLSKGDIDTNQPHILARKYQSLACTLPVFAAPPEAEAEQSAYYEKQMWYFHSLTESESKRADKAEHRAGCMAARAFDYDCHRQRLGEAARKVIEWCRQEAEDRTGNAENAEFYSCVKELRAALAFVETAR